MKGKAYFKVLAVLLTAGRRTAIEFPSTDPSLPEGKTLRELPITEHAQKKKTAKPYSPEFRERAVRLLLEHRDDYQSEAAAWTAIAGKLGCSPDSLRVWVRQAQRQFWIEQCYVRQQYLRHNTHLL